MTKATTTTTTTSTGDYSSSSNNKQKSSSTAIIIGVILGIIICVLAVLLILYYRRRRVPVNPLIKQQVNMTENPLYVSQGNSTSNDGPSNNSAELPHRPYSLHPHPRSEPEGGNVYSILHVALDSSRENSSQVQQARPPAPARQVIVDHYDALGGTQDALPFSRRQDGSNA